jgi:rhodanese-related sulfurtransferase
MPEPRIIPVELAELLRSGAAVEVLDVREAAELAICSLAGARHTPMSEFPEHAAAMDRDADYIVVCHHGMRSARVAEWMRTQGFTRVRDLVGGVDAWALEVDPSMARY